MFLTRCSYTPVFKAFSCDIWTSSHAHSNMDYTTIMVLNPSIRGYCVQLTVCLASFLFLLYIYSVMFYAVHEVVLQ